MEKDEKLIFTDLSKPYRRPRNRVEGKAKVKLFHSTWKMRSGISLRIHGGGSIMQNLKTWKLMLTDVIYPACQNLGEFLLKNGQKKQQEVTKKEIPYDQKLAPITWFQTGLELDISSQWWIGLPP